MREEQEKELCYNCPHFRIAYEPIKADKGYWDLGRAVCEKHNLITDFATRRKLKRLECWEKSTADKEEQA